MEAVPGGPRPSFKAAAGTYHADQLAILDFGVLVAVGFVSSDDAVVQPPSEPHHLHVKTPRHLRPFPPPGRTATGSQTP